MDAQHLLLPLLLLASLTPHTCADLPGTWELIVSDAGICSMHTAVTRFNTVVLLDRTAIGPSPLPFPGPCTPSAGHDCTAHSAVLDLSTNRIRPLRILTNTWCSSGQFLPDGTLLQTGGDGDGLRKIRSFKPCPPNKQCDWTELTDVELGEGRWYATNQVLPDGSVIIIGGREARSVEFYPPKTGYPRSLPFLTEVEDRQTDNLYPYVHLLPDGHLFIFANNNSILYDYESDSVIRQYPPLDGGPRNYPSAGSSAMLALDFCTNFSTVEILVCGGTDYGVFFRQDLEYPAHKTCGRMVVTDPDPCWEMEEMPFGRVMGDMVVLPTGDVLIINGAGSGSQGFGLGANPVLHPVLYRPDQPSGLRFMVLNPTSIPRMYHSTANLLPDGRVLISGSNPHYFYKFGEGVKFPTELRIEAFSPEYLLPEKASVRPVVVEAPERVGYGEEFEVVVDVGLPVVERVEVNLASAPFATHSFLQGQRLLRLETAPAEEVDGGGEAVEGGGRYRIGCIAPPSAAVAPPGYYMAFVVNQGIPGVATWIQIV
ncbi:hypothetical protein QJS10_CPA03g01757 [Acorus calamus]|uniref:Aldehyde oxidase GLOX n=1 Tax=Acorus calamus TaxID=4465 RepID=A0AAV9F7E0_ACOCL|nr:hypothetical protein QJS10_CPA03g01757 [Acorus calamus]